MKTTPDMPLTVIGTLESAFHYIQGVQNDLHLADNGILEDITNTITKIKDSIPVKIPEDIEVSFDGGSDDECLTIFGETVKGAVFGSDTVLVNVLGEVSAIKTEHITFYGPEKLKKWNEADDFDAIYIPENNDGPISKWQFIRMMDGNEDAAQALFDTCEWQYPATLIDEMGMDFFTGGQDE